jgi:RNA recognition motif-containing protein
MAQQFYKLFIRNLPWTVSSHELRTYFSQFGYVTRATVLYNNDTGLSRGFGYVDFNKREAFEAVMSQPQHVLEGQRLRVEEGSSRRRSSPNRDDSSSMNMTKKRENTNHQQEEQF